jgi:Family of unknown function (DUF6519)
MNGDFKTDITRDTFHRRKHFARVLMQQGRVQLDADWNEQMDILLHYMRTLAADLIGPHGGPDGPELGFEIIPRADVPPQQEEEEEEEEEEEGKRRRKRGRKQKQQEYSKPPQQVTNAFEFVVSEGRYYVDGILCENDRERYVFTIPGDIRGTDGNKTYIFYLDVWEREVTYLEDGSIREVALNGPDTTTRSKVEWRIRVQDITKMKGAPSLDDSKFSPNNQFNLAAYKKEWTDFLQNWFKANRGLLKAKTIEPENAYTDPCTIPPSSQFRGRENQLYRVEIHRGGIAYQEPLGQGGQGGQSSYRSTGGGSAYQQSRRGSASGTTRATQAQQQTYATFTWSRENGSVVFPISGSIGEGTVAANSSITVTLEGLGRDDSRFNLQEEEWVEIVDIEDMLEGQPGPLFQVTNVDNTTMEVTLVPQEDVTLDSDTEKNLLLRRWDYKEGDPEQKGAIQLADDGAALLIENKWLTLEDGVQVLFHREVEDQDEKGEIEDVDQAPQYRTGDYWVIPARTATGGIEWPSHDHEHFALPPHGVEHHYAPLTVAVVDRNGVVVKDQQSGNERKHDLRYKIKGAGM